VENQISVIKGLHKSGKLEMAALVAAKTHHANLQDTENE
jgi:hypothetical protein